MASSTPKSAFWRGFRDGAPFILVVSPFAVVFGVVATEAGLSILETMGFAVLVVAGASSLAALQLMADQAPTIVVLATALAVNLRMAMYSAGLAPYLGAAPLWERVLVAYLNADPPFALSSAEYERRPEMTLAERLAFFFGVASAITPFWYFMSYAGARFGAVIPPGFALDFAVPITFLALVAPMVRTLAHLAAALTSVMLALTLAWVPAGLGLLLAATGAMLVGAQVELWSGRRA